MAFLEIRSVHKRFGHLEVLRGIVLDVYMLARGYNATVYGVWIVIHAAVIATELYSLRAYQTDHPGIV